MRLPWNLGLEAAGLDGRHAAAQWAGVALAVALGGGLVFYNRGLLLYLPNNDIVLRDQYRESVGVDGYFSATIKCARIFITRRCKSTAG
jgi:hypothetical protein